MHDTLRGEVKTILFGAVGSPDVPDTVTVQGLILPMRRRFDQYVNLRPAYLFDGVPSPLCDRDPKTGVEAPLTWGKRSSGATTGTAVGDCAGQTLGSIRRRLLPSTRVVVAPWVRTS